MTRFSVLTPVYDPAADVLVECIDSVRDQTFDDWQLVLVDDASPSPHVAEILTAAAATDPRITVVHRPTNGGIVAASNDAVDAAVGEIFVLLDHDDLLAPTALERIDEAFTPGESDDGEEPDDVDYVYTDEDVLHPTGGLVEPFFKPDWSPERFRNQMYTCHVSAMRASLVREVGAFRDGFEGSQDWDLVFRVTERARRIVHVPEVLYHWRIVPTSVLAGEHVKPYAYVSAQKAIEEHCERVGIDGEVVESVPPGPLPGRPPSPRVPAGQHHHPHPLFDRSDVGGRAGDGARSGAQHRRAVDVAELRGRAGGRPAGRRPR